MPLGDVLDAETERIAKIIVDSAYRVHSALGPGLLESVYEHCLVVELVARGLKVERQVVVPIIYRDTQIEPGLRLDLLVEGKIVIENKSVEKIIPLHESQIITYLKLSNKRLGFLVNFNVVYIKDGIKRIIL